MKLGASFTALTVIVKKFGGADSSTPPLAVPPLSCATSVIVAVPLAFAVGVYVSVPVELIVGPAANRLGLLLPVMMKFTVWPASLAGPGLIPVAQVATTCAPASSFAV